jgi:hypothetical protein
MVYLYDNGTYEPYYSEAFRTLSEPRDWADLGAKTLTLYFRGSPTNEISDTDHMYVGLEDGGGPESYAEVRYGDNGEDMNDVKVAEWHQWDICLQHFSDAGLAIADVNKLYIGFGDRTSPTPGGWGVVYFDDIRLSSNGCGEPLSPSGSTGKPIAQLKNPAALEGKRGQLAHPFCQRARGLRDHSTKHGPAQPTLCAQKRSRHTQISSCKISRVFLQLL